MQKPFPQLLLADMVLDAVFEVRVVVDLDDDDWGVAFLDVDAVKAGADRVRRLERIGLIPLRPRKGPRRSPAATTDGRAFSPIP
jgi:hypothetical protein